MQLVFLPSARDDLGALRRYCALRGGAPATALAQARAALTGRVLRRYPIGPPGLREVPLPQLPFHLVCRFQGKRCPDHIVTG